MMMMRRNYHERAAEFFESLVEEKRNRKANYNTNIEEEAEEGHSIVMSYAYHLHMAGGRYHEKSFTYKSWCYRLFYFSQSKQW